MKKEDNKDFDYLQILVIEQVRELRSYGPVVYDVLGALQPPTETIEVESLVHTVIKKQKTVVEVETDGLNLRTSPAFDGPVIKVLPRGSQLIVTETEGEGKIGMAGQWLQVVDDEGHNGFVVAGYVAKTSASADPRKKVDQVMQTLEYFSRTELVKIDQQPGKYFVSLTQKGRYMADLITSPSQGAEAL
jgi:hypothetical protein